MKTNESESEFSKMRFSAHQELSMLRKLSLLLVRDGAASEEVVYFFSLLSYLQVIRIACYEDFFFFGLWIVFKVSWDNCCQVVVILPCLSEDDVQMGNVCRNRFCYKNKSQMFQFQNQQKFWATILLVHTLTALVVVY